MHDRVVVIGGGLAGLSAGCHALRSGFRVTIVEHNLELGGVCTAWERGPYTVDGCIHWLTGGPYTRVYEELGILPSVPLRVLSEWATYRDARSGFAVTITQDLDALVAELVRTSKADAVELERLRRSAAAFAEVTPPIDAQELSGPGDALGMLWHSRGALPALVHYRKPVAVWAEEHLSSPQLRRLFTHLFPPTAPALFVLMVLGYLERGFLSRPLGGTSAFRDALVRTFRELGGEARVHSTVDEILVQGDRARGVRLADGTMVDADIVISTASAPETVLRLLGGRYDADATRERLAEWKLFDPLVLASFGVALPYASAPSLLIVDQVEPFLVGCHSNDGLYVRTCNDDPKLAPPGHSVVQALMPTSYDFWATRGTRYGDAKDVAAATALAQLEPHFPDIRSAVRMVDIATPLTYWNMTRSWRGAYEGWMPTASAFFGHVNKTLAGLRGFYQAGQWVEPGGGIPTAVTSGRQAVQLLCKDERRTFAAARPA